MIKAIIFDVDGVLVDSFEANFKFFQELFTKTGYKPPTREEYKKLFAKSLKDVIQTVTNESEEKVQEIWELGASRGVPHDVNLMKMPVDADKIIKQLSKSYQLGLVTSRIREYLFEAPQLAELKNYFKVAVTYEDTVKHKPDPEPLLLAVEQFGIKPDEAVYIGDADSDVKAARDAGMKIISFPKKLEGADLSFSNFSELQEVIQSL